MALLAPKYNVSYSAHHFNVKAGNNIGKEFCIGRVFQEILSGQDLSCLPF